MRRSTKPYCPYNGCAMPNGAAMPLPRIWKCGHKGDTWDKYCKECFHCVRCGRIIRKNIMGFQGRRIIGCDYCGRWPEIVKSNNNKGYFIWWGSGAFTLRKNGKVEEVKDDEHTFWDNELDAIEFLIDFFRNHYRLCTLGKYNG